MNELLKKQIELLPENPGSYQMFDKDNNIIYIGKAKNLKKRVSQYFLRPQSGKTQAMVSNIDHFEIIITKTEKEAFILEMNLIQKYLPKYNILLKDDKHYPYIALFSRVKNPYISIARNIKDKRADYFGPFSSSSSAYEVINLLNLLYPLRKCKSVPKNSCLYYHLNQCLAPCIKDIKEEDYKDYIHSIKNFLKGDNNEVIIKLKEKIKIYSTELDFENALIYKKYLDAIIHINDTQNVEFLDKKDIDIFAYSIRENYLSLGIFIYRKGILITKRNYIYEIIDELDQFLVNIITQYYKYNLLPSEIIISNKNIKEDLELYLENKIIYPQKGKLFELINLVQINAKEMLDLHFSSARLEDDKLEILENLGRILNIKTPLYIELFDNSHLQGSSAIGAMVAYINGEANKKMYRKYNIESFNKKDDISSMKEVAFRRYSRLIKEEHKLPDLILLDGGINQINAVNEVLHELNIFIPLAGLVKNKEHRTKNLMNSKGEIISLINNQKLFYFLTRMQDEVHRYAISTHIKKRSKKLYRSIFDDIKGIGIKRKEILTKTYATLEDLNNASIEELSQILPKDVAINLKEKLEENFNE